MILAFTAEQVLMESLGLRISATVAAIVGWLAFIVLYLAFFAGTFDFWQKLAIFIASGAIALGIIAIFWIRWAIK
jgi:hypothetical protein